MQFPIFMGALFSGYFGFSWEFLGIFRFFGYFFLILFLFLFFFKHFFLVLLHLKNKRLQQKVTEATTEH